MTEQEDKFAELRKVANELRRPAELLIVDDDNVLLHLLRHYFQDHENVIRLDTAERGTEALSMITRKHYDLIILDMRLEGEMDGLDVFREIRENDKETPVVFLTGYADDERFKKLPEIGWATIVKKPLDTADLHSLIKVFTGKEIVS